MTRKTQTSKTKYDRSAVATARVRDGNGRFIPQDTVKDIVKGKRNIGGTSASEGAAALASVGEKLSSTAKSKSPRISRRAAKKAAKKAAQVQQPRNTEERRIAAEAEAKRLKRSAAGKKAAATRARRLADQAHNETAVKDMGAAIQKAEQAKQPEPAQDVTDLLNAAEVLQPGQAYPLQVVAPVIMPSTDGMAPLSVLTQKRPMVEKFVRCRAIGERSETTYKTVKHFGIFKSQVAQTDHIVIVELPTGDMRELPMERVYQVKE